MGDRANTAESAVSSHRNLSCWRPLRRTRRRQSGVLLPAPQATLHFLYRRWYGFLQACATLIAQVAGVRKGMYAHDSRKIDARFPPGDRGLSPADRRRRRIRDPQLSARRGARPSLVVRPDRRGGGRHAAILAV